MSAIPEDVRTLLRHEAHLVAGHEAAHTTAARVAAREARLVLGARGAKRLRRTDVEAAVDMAGRVYDHLWIEGVRDVDAHVVHLYERSRERAWRQVLARGPVRRKAKEPPARSTLDLADQKAVENLRRQHAYWTSRHYAKNLRASIDRAIRSTLTGQGLTGKQGASAVRAPLEEAFGRVEAPSSWKGSATEYVRLLATVAATRARSAGTLRTLDQLGVRYAEWVADLDEKTCDRCSLLDGRRFPVRESAALAGRALATPDPRKIKEIAPWYSETDLLSLIASSERDGDLVEAGVSIPLHASCRCSWEIHEDSDISWGDLDDPVALGAREVVGRDLAGPVLLSVPEHLRDEVGRTSGLLAGGTIPAPALSFVAALPLPDVFDERARRLIPVVPSKDRLIVRTDSLLRTEAGGWSALAWALGIHVARNLNRDDLDGLHENARVTDAVLHESGRRDPESWFAASFEAFAADDKVPGTSDDVGAVFGSRSRSTLRRRDPVLHDALLALAQKNEVPRAPLRTDAREPLPPGPDDVLLEAVGKVRSAPSWGHFLAATKSVLDLLEPKSDTAAFPWLLALVVAGTVSGWL